MRVVTYGIGGYDPKRRDGNIIADVDIPDSDADPATVAIGETVDRNRAFLDTAKPTADELVAHVRELTAQVTDLLTGASPAADNLPPT